MESKPAPQKSEQAGIQPLVPTPAVKSSAHERVSQEMSWLARRIASMLLGIWLGGMPVISIATPAAYFSVDDMLTSTSPAPLKALKQLGATTERELLFQQVSESNRRLYQVWGYGQLTLAVVVFLMLLFFTTVRRPVLGLSLGMLLMALLMNLFLIPRISAIGRQMSAGAPLDPVQAMQRFRMLHMGFALFEAAVALMAIVLATLLLRARSKSVRARRRSSHSEIPEPG